MDLPRVAPYGLWKSSINSEFIAFEALRKFTFVDIDQNFNIYFDEVKSEENGRNTIFKRKVDGTVEEILPGKFSAKTSVYEYGGKSFFLKNNDLFFTNFDDQIIYRLDQGGKIAPITLSTKGKIRYADVVFDKKRNFIFCVREEHKEDCVVNAIVRIDLLTGEQKILLQKHDFYGSLALSPDKKTLAYICWDFPSMPWDGSYLMVCDVADNGDLVDSRVVAGAENESVCLPGFSSENILYFVSDRTGFYNIYYLAEVIESLLPMNADFAGPRWVSGQSSYAFVEKAGGHMLYAVYTKEGRDFLIEIDLKTKKFKDLSLPFSHYSSLKAFKDKVVFIASSPKDSRRIILWESVSNDLTVIAESREPDKDNISEPQAFCFPTTDGAKAFAFYYPPLNVGYVAPKDSLPPLIVKVHGGPTAHFSPEFSLDTQYWTSRGFAVAEVNYRGSSGYGRKYREMLKGKWGVVDVEDCEKAALFFCKNNMADKNRLVIKGSSAGGYTVLVSLALRDIFKVGGSYYGVSDLEQLVFHTHKFESKYLENLIGLYPERKDLYYTRSPINFIERFSAPVILFQGAEDKIVLEDQSRKIYESLKRKNIPAVLVVFEKEGHGFRCLKNIKKALNEEYTFYSKVLKL